MIDRSHKRLASQACQTTPHDPISNGVLVDFVNGIQYHEARHKNPHITILTSSPPASLDADFPGAINAGAERVQKGGSTMLAFEKSRQSAQEATPKPALLGYERTRKEVLKKADTAPGCTNGRGGQKGHSCRPYAQLAHLLKWRLEKLLVGW